MNHKLDDFSQDMWMKAEDHECKAIPLAHAYVRWQHYQAAFSPHEALMKGTLFPELYGVYMPPK